MGPKIVLNTPGIVAQLAHIGWGAFLTLLLRRWMPTLDAAFTVLLASAIKEAVECTLGVWEPIDTIKGSTVDYIFWMAGVLLGSL